ncbi:hypothetical protein SLEP1_g22604 [Rubroshorea leprosula]|uniref:Uncharacterized protein n=1 Tax=Rubroshorea leprosula TaxID=152421 RepID=A0AAV5JKL5_9ROSI|nr:hypothetical protein SLEP1_g22604 [Rubroshorea leprosula]
MELASVLANFGSVVTVHDTVNRILFTHRGNSIMIRGDLNEVSL